jgi:hypothetical protein
MRWRTEVLATLLRSTWLGGIRHSALSERGVAEPLFETVSIFEQTIRLIRLRARSELRQGGLYGLCGGL